MFVENDRMERKLPIEHSRLHVGNLKIFLFLQHKKNAENCWKRVRSGFLKGEYTEKLWEDIEN